MRASGILLHITSLPSPFGIGSLGKEASEFIDFLAKAGQKYWQILPLNPTGYGDSPYQSFSVFAGNPYLIDLRILKEQRLLTDQDLEGLDCSSDCEIDYGYLYATRFDQLKKAFNRFDAENNKPYEEFIKKNESWIKDYSLFMVLKDHFGQYGHNSWQEWPEDIKCRTSSSLEHYKSIFASEMQFYCFLQFEFFRQFDMLKIYANQKGVKFIGDMPIYVSADSADCWANTELFQLDEQRNPIRVAGCPPDAFTSDGQLWGNPLYRWDVHKSQNFDWWVKRIEHQFKSVDCLRIDHFRGFESYYAIPAQDTTAARGVWEKGPGIALFNAINKALGAVNIIAEDLGYLTEDVRQLLKASGYPGMKVLQFAFDSRESSNYLPHNYDFNCAVYTGTHDNDTVAGWYHSALPQDVSFAAEYLQISCQEDYPWAFIRGAWASTANLAVAPMQDFLALGSEARMNQPSTLGSNWCWRLKPDALTEELVVRIKRITELYER